MGKYKAVHTVEKCDEWLSTRTKRKIKTSSTATPGKRASLSRPLRNIGNILTKTSPPPSELKTHTKQSTLSKFVIKSNRTPEISNIDDESLESSEELPTLAGDYYRRNRHHATDLLSYTGDQIHTYDEVDTDNDDDELPTLAVIKHHNSSRIKENKINSQINRCKNNERTRPLTQESGNEAHTDRNGFIGQLSYGSNCDTEMNLDDSEEIPLEGCSESIQNSSKISGPLSDIHTELNSESISNENYYPNFESFHSKRRERADCHETRIPQSTLQHELEHPHCLDTIYDLTEDTNIKSQSRKAKTMENVIDLDVCSNHSLDSPRKSKHYYSEVKDDFDIELMTENTLKHSHGSAGRIESLNSDLSIATEVKSSTDNCSTLIDREKSMNSCLYMTTEVKTPTNNSLLLPTYVDYLNTDLCTTEEVKTPSECSEVLPQSLNSLNFDIDLSGEDTGQNDKPLSLPQSVNSLTSDLDLMTEFYEYEGHLISTQEADQELDNFDYDSQVDI